MGQGMEILLAFIIKEISAGRKTASGDMSGMEVRIGYE